MDNILEEVKREPQREQDERREPDIDQEDKREPKREHTEEQGCNISQYATQINVFTTFLKAKLFYIKGRFVRPNTSFLSFWSNYRLFDFVIVFDNLNLFIHKIKIFHSIAKN